MAHQNDEQSPIAIPVERLKELAAQVADEMKSGSVPRAKFIEVRAALFQRGIYDPLLVRFDSATAPQASMQELGEQLANVAASL